MKRRTLYVGVLVLTFAGCAAAQDDVQPTVCYVNGNGPFPANSCECRGTCGSSSSSSSSSSDSSTSSGAAGSNNTYHSTMPPSLPRTNIPDPMYTDEYKRKVLSGEAAREKAEEPFEYDDNTVPLTGGQEATSIWGHDFLSKVRSLYGTYCIPSSLQTCPPEDINYDDSMLMADWIDHLLEYPAIVLFLHGQDPNLVHDVLDELNKRTIDKVETALRKQMINLSPMIWDTVEEKKRKQDNIEEVDRWLKAYRSDVSNAFRMKYRLCPDLASCAQREADGYYTIQPSSQLKKLMELSKDGDWRHLEE